VYPKFATELLRSMMANPDSPKKSARKLLRTAQKAAGVKITSALMDGVEVAWDL
jgi:hypothetical protein